MVREADCAACWAVGLRPGFAHVAFLVLVGRIKAAPLRELAGMGA